MPNSSSSADNDWRFKARWLETFDEFVQEAALSLQADTSEAWRIPIADQMDDETGEVRACASIKEAYESLRDADLLAPRPVKSARYSMLISFFGQNHTPFVTTGGLLGLSPQCALPGDSVWVLTGSDTPTVLRAAEDDTYGVVGEAYVQGLMDGEALCSGAPVENVVIV